MSRGRAMNAVSWGIFAAFASFAFYFNWHPMLFEFDTRFGSLKAFVWTAFALFLSYSIYCSTKENIFRTVAAIAKYHWGRQIGIDLYLGLLIALTLIYLNEGALILVFWLIPVLLFANLAVLLYLGIHFDSIATKLFA